MKTFKNQQTTITMTVVGEKGKKSLTTMTYVDLAMLVLNIPPSISPKGETRWPRAEQKLRFKIEDKIENLKVEQEIQLEDAEFNKIFELSQQDWTFKHRDLLKYLDHLDEWNKEE